VQYYIAHVRQTQFSYATCVYVRDIMIQLMHPNFFKAATMVVMFGCLLDEDWIFSGFYLLRK